MWLEDLLKEGCGSYTVSPKSVGLWAVAFEAAQTNTCAMSVFHIKTSQSLREDLAMNVKYHRAHKTSKLHRFISQERCALEAGIDRTMMSKIERAKTNPSLETLLKLANYLNVSVSELLIEPSKSNKGRKA